MSGCVNRQQKDAAKDTAEKWLCGLEPTRVF